MFEWIIFEMDESGKWSEIQRLWNGAAEEDVKQLGALTARAQARPICVTAADTHGVHGTWTFDKEGKLFHKGG